MPELKGGGGKLKVFISYSRADTAFADELVDGLELLGFDTSIDRHSIAEGEFWKSRLGALIADADSVVFILSPDSASSDTCAWEVEEAHRLLKRIIPVLYRPLGSTSAPPRLAALNYVRFDEGRSFMAGLRALGRALETDLEWLREHTRLFVRAREWHDAGRVANRMLSGSDIVAAKDWAERRPQGAPELTELHLDYIRASEQAESDRTSAERKRLEEIAAAQADRARALESEAQASRRLVKRTIGGLVAAVALALAAIGAGAVAYLKQQEAERERAIAEITRDDATEVARVARLASSDANADILDRWEDLTTWSPPARRGHLLHNRAQRLAEAGDFSTARTDLDKALKIDPSLVPLLTSSADTYVISAEPNGAVRDATKAMAAGAVNAPALSNLWLAEAMQGEYASALGHIEEALGKSPRTISSTETLVSPDIQGITRGFKLRVRNTDFLLALRYSKAVLYAIMGDDRFKAALAEADTSDRDHPFSRSAYLAALNWEWLILRGQAVRRARAEKQTDDGKPSAAPAALIHEYGAYAVQGALWARVAATRPDFAAYAKSAFERFAAAHAADAQDKYKGLAAWVAEERDRTFAKAEPESALDEALELEVRAIELSRAPGGETYRVRVPLTVALLSDAIHKLDPAQTGRPLGRREEDLMIDLLLRRGDWRLKASEDQEKDYGGARQDAQRILEIDGKIASAYSLLASASRDQDERRQAFEKALDLDPANTDALSGLAGIWGATDAKKALSFKERERNLRRFWSYDYADLARLEAKLGLHREALENIAQAIGLTPWNRDYYQARSDYEVGSGVEQTIADLHLAQGYHARADFYARTGDDRNALSAFVEALRAAARLPDDPSSTLELSSIANDLSAFLERRFERKVAIQWWNSVAVNPLMSDREKRLAVTEADRVAAQK